MCPTLPELAYGAETVQRMRNLQRKMERSMLGISLIQIQSGTKELLGRRSQNFGGGPRFKTYVFNIKWCWAGHLARCGDTSWRKALTERLPREDKR